MFCPRRVLIDMVRPVKAFDDLRHTVVMELQRTPGATAKLALEVEAIDGTQRLF